MSKNVNKKMAVFAKKPLSTRLGIAIALSILCLIAELFIEMYLIMTYTDYSMQIKILLVSVVGFLLFLLSVVVMVSIIKSQTDPIVELTYKANSIAKGNFKVTIPEFDVDNEIARLRDSFDYLQTSINNIIIDVVNTTANNERIQSELHVASMIQKAMLPKDFPHTRDIDLAAMLSPAKEIGGDLYDFYIEDEKLYFTIGDVSGKGVPAALYMAITRSSFRFSSGMGMKINEIVARINKVFAAGNTSQMFVTMFAGVLDLNTKQLEYCNAGHNPIIIINPDGEANYLHSKYNNIAIGLVEDFPYEMETITLKEGYRILLYTDGVPEAERADQSQYGEQRLLDFANSITRSKSAEDVMDELYRSVSSFTSGNPQNDDITIMSFLLNNLN